jgi:hypothetical protein
MGYAGFTDRSGPGGVVHNPASAYAREMAKWEMGYSPYGPPGRPREREGQPQWPAMFYKVKRDFTSGKIIVEHSEAAADEAAGRNFLSRGYVQGLKAAHDALEDSEQQRAVGAAVRAHDDLRMSDAAKAEAARFEDTTVEHVTEIPATPIVRRQPKETK